MATYAPIGGFVPFATVGGGVITQAGDLPSVTLRGTYRFAIGGTVPVNETDHAVLRYSNEPSLVALAGGGLSRDVSDRWGLRIDARVPVGRNENRLVVDTFPSVATGTPAGFIESSTYPNLQFSDNPSTGRVSTLGGSGLQEFSTFRGGIQTRVRITVGVAGRF